MSKLPAIAALVLSATFSLGAHALTPAATGADYGVPVTDGASGRVIRISAATKYVHVTNGEAVTFEFDGQRFGWQVSTYSNVNEFALKQILPPGTQLPAVRVIVAPNPLYLGI
ncbi:CzcE family metal-binding protein [Massilia sp. CF038]|uniref:CzcE family metal-binding protein n=1 Tax=Massilia sp. CF038 TaxID=1881045 RepID=UPI00091674A3|nr:CzcE family metal-binding protein [Massilia sp. CF038]SHG72181.1 Heavy-metal resistance protein CzcE [Massilia sp. CF038]